MFEILNDEEKDVILQTNRLHFVLDKIRNNYNIPAVHIIRNPLDVFYSAIYNNARRKRYFFINYAYKIRHTKLGKFLAFKIFQHIKNKNLFGVYDSYKLLNDIFNLDYKNLTFFEMLLVVWTYFNYFATKNIGKDNIFYYDEFIENPENFEKLNLKEKVKYFYPKLIK